MFLKNFKGNEFDFTYDEKTIEYTLINKKCGIKLTISGKDAFFFQRHIGLITEITDETRNILIEEAIGFYLSVCIYFNLEQNKKKK